MIESTVLQITTVPGSRSQSLLEVTFLLNLFYSDTIIVSIPELSTLGKLQVKLELGCRHATEVV